MSKQPHKGNQGFSAVEVVIALFVLAAIGIGGWYVWHAQSNTADKKSITTTRQHENGEVKDDSSERGAYFVIKEWGVRFPLSDDLKGDIKYGLFVRNDYDSQVAYFTSRTVAAIKPGGQCDVVPREETFGEGQSGGFMAVERTSIAPEADNHRVVYQADGYWYITDSSQGGPCFEDDADNQKIPANFESSLEAALNHLEKVPSD